MKTWDPRLSLLEEALIRGADDWVDVADFTNIAQRSGAKNSESLRAVALGLIAEMLGRGLIRPGRVDDFGFHPWDESAVDAIERIVQTWNEDDPFPTPGSVAWFDLTPKGKELARAAVQRAEELD